MKVVIAGGGEIGTQIAGALHRSHSVSIIDTFRALGNQGNYTGPTDAASLLTEIIDQRRRTLWLTGTHFGDVVRYNLTVTPAAGLSAPGKRQDTPMMAISEARPEETGVLSS